jgi:tripartite-type tricarboxylate transporter receptor subunit TctC
MPASEYDRVADVIGRTDRDRVCTLLRPSLKAKLPYDPLASFESIGIMGSSPLVLLANPSVPANTVKELVALA